jgi:hypothetical protein
MACSTPIPHCTLRRREERTPPGNSFDRAVDDHHTVATITSEGYQVLLFEIVQIGSALERLRSSTFAQHRVVFDGFRHLVDYYVS